MEPEKPRTVPRGFSSGLTVFRFCSRMPHGIGRPSDLPYFVELWDDTDSHVEELIALTGDYRVARAAFEEVVKRRPGRIVTLQKVRLLADSRRRN